MLHASLYRKAAYHAAFFVLRQALRLLSTRQWSMVVECVFNVQPKDSWDGARYGGFRAYGRAEERSATIEGTEGIPMSGQPDQSTKLLELQAEIRKNLDATCTIAARVVVLMKFRDAVLPYLSASNTHGLLDAFDWSLEEAMPVAADFASLPAYSQAFLEEIAAIRAAIATASQRQ